jgi:ornithine lipid ester-linked acyl 2-hydroxylase
LVTILATAGLANVKARSPREAAVPLVASQSKQPDCTRRRRPLTIRLGKRLRGPFDRVIAASSLVSNAPVLDARQFAWTRMLRENWTVIRAEAERVVFGCHAAPSLATISPDHQAIAEVGKWRSFFLRGYGYAIDENLARCPHTASLLEAVPGINTAFFSILAPGTHIPKHRGVTKSLLTCHLGLIVPETGDARMRIADRLVRWKEGDTLVFDDTHDHEVWNDARETRVVLLIQFARPLRQPGRWLAKNLLRAIRRSAFVQEARTNLLAWNAAVAMIES